MKNYSSLIDALSDLRSRGYDADFETTSFCLYCGDLDIRFNPEAFHVDEVYHFEKEERPADREVIYAITSETGVKGTLVDGYLACTEKLNFEMAEKLRFHRTGEQRERSNEIYGQETLHRTAHIFNCRD